MSQDTNDREERATCIECGASMWIFGSRLYVCAPDTYLCVECAERRGGVYDEVDDRWLEPPDVSGLFDERRPHP